MNKLNIKLFILPIITIVAMVILSFLFSQKIDRLKKEVDLIYFGNFNPVHMLHTIKERYVYIIHKKNVDKNDTKFIQSKWKKYFSSYKTQKEKIFLNEVDTQIKKGFKSKNIKDFRYSLDHFEKLIKHEVDSAYIQRQAFLSQYEKMQDYLLWTQIIIVLFVIIISGYIAYQIFQQANHFQKLSEQYKMEANTDALTKLYNRKCFDGIFNDIIPLTKQNNWQSVFVMIDIDFFKQFNDTYGHDAGDIALKKVSRVLEIILDKEYEYPFRLGGEEFGIIIFNTNEKYVRYTLNNIQHHIKQLQIPHSASKTGFLTLSMGVTMIDKKLFNHNAKSIYTLTDKKLYHSKEHGRNQYTF